jgi:hypothetical protein
VGNVGGLGALGFAYFVMYKEPGDPECSGSMATACDIGRFIFYYYTAIYVSGLLGAPWDAFLLWAVGLPDTSP